MPSTLANVSSCSVESLPAADYITMLDGGRIVRNQVLYDLVEASVWAVLEQDSDKTASDSTEGTADVAAEMPLSEEEASDATKKVEAELTRRIGDYKC